MKGQGQVQEAGKPTSLNADIVVENTLTIT